MIYIYCIYGKGKLYCPVIMLIRQFSRCYITRLFNAQLWSDQRKMKQLHYNEATGLLPRVPTPFFVVLLCQRCEGILRQLIFIFMGRPGSSVSRIRVSFRQPSETQSLVYFWTEAALVQYFVDSFQIFTRFLFFLFSILFYCYFYNTWDIRLYPAII